MLPEASVFNLGDSPRSVVENISREAEVDNVFNIRDTRIIVVHLLSESPDQWIRRMKVTHGELLQLSHVQPFLIDR